MTYGTGHATVLLVIYVTNCYAVSASVKHSASSCHANALGGHLGACNQLGAPYPT